MPHITAVSGPCCASQGCMIDSNKASKGTLTAATPGPSTVSRTAAAAIAEEQPQTAGSPVPDNIARAAINAIPGRRRSRWPRSRNRGRSPDRPASRAERRAGSSRANTLAAAALASTPAARAASSSRRYQQFEPPIRSVEQNLVAVSHHAPAARRPRLRARRAARQCRMPCRSCGHRRCAACR